MRAPACTLTATSEPEESRVRVLPFTALTVPMRLAMDCCAESSACACAASRSTTESRHALHTTRSTRVATYRFIRLPYFTLLGGPQLYDLQSFTQTKERLQRTR